ncbi:MAG: hypothetical protein J6P94_05660 [Oscillospiraceae bacterium]|nr:hypothetical protein [Oscillospiraceae bacterium]
MFGYIEANAVLLNEEQLARYKGCYCGLCRALKERHGQLSRITLSFDMTFLIMFLSSMYEPEEKSGEANCIVHPFKKRCYWSNRFTDYAADMNLALAYYNCLDDWNDDRNVLRYAQAKAFEDKYKEIKNTWPRQCGAIERCISTLKEIEKNPGSEIDEAANCFGELMGELFVCDEDSVWAPRIRLFGQALGKFIYIMDACVDIEKDKKHSGYNPFINGGHEELSEEDRLLILKMHAGECTRLFELFPLLQDTDIMRNVLFSGVWHRYSMAIRKNKEDTQVDK